MKNIQKLFANRIGGERFGEEKLYKFEKIKRAKKEAKQKHPTLELLDFGVGEPDEMAFESVRETLKREVDDPANRVYADNGIHAYKEAAARYMKKVFGVELDPEHEINPTIGSKSALAMTPALFINPGDITFTTTPGYPVLSTHTQWYGGDVIHLPLREEHGFLPQLDTLSTKDKQKGKILVLNYPNNPTGAQATKTFYEKCIQFAKESELVIIQDAAYGALVYDGAPLSILSVPGAKDIAVEFHSLSKSYNMTGWRIGFVCGNPQIIKAFSHVKDNIDSGQFIAIQKAAITALDNPSITEEIKAKYSRRLDALVQILQKQGFRAKKPAGTFYLYVEAPLGTKSGLRFQNAEAFSQFLIYEKLISTVPWDDEGAFVRFSATFQAQGMKSEQEVLAELERRLKSIEFTFQT